MRQLMEQTLGRFSQKLAELMNGQMKGNQPITTRLCFNQLLIQIIQMKSMNFSFYFYKSILKGYPLVSYFLLLIPNIQPEKNIQFVFFALFAVFAAFQGMLHTFKTITKIKSILNQQMNLIDQQETERPHKHSLQVTKKNSTRPNSFIEPLPSFLSSQNDQNFCNHAFIQIEPALNKKSETEDQFTIKGDRFQIDYLNEEAVRSIIMKIEKNEKIKIKTKICLQMIILKRCVHLNKKLSHLFESCTKKYQKYLLEELD